MKAGRSIRPVGDTGPGEAFRRVFSDMIAEDGVCERVEERTEGDPVDAVRTAVVIEDESDIRALVAQVLEQVGFVVHAASDGLTGVELVRRHDPLVTTLDVSMPGIDGFETAKRIRAISATYLVMLTARTDEIDTLQGLQAGADDYLTKPFRPRELRARVEAMMRRPRHLAGSAAPQDGRGGDVGWLEHGDLRVQPDMRRAELDGRDLSLTRSEFDILLALMRAERRVVSKTDLVLMLRGGQEHDAYVSEHDARAVEVHMANLRRKLGESATNPQWIETIRGAGYSFNA